MTRCLTAVCHLGVPMMRCVLLASLPICLAAVPVGAPMPAAVVDTCLAVDRLASTEVSIDPVAGRREILRGGPLSAYDLYLPDGDNRSLRIGYASASSSAGDYLFVNSHRGYIDRAIPLGGAPAPRLERPRQASFALLRHLDQSYLCLMEMLGQEKGGSQRAVFVARIPATMGRELSLYYKLAYLSAD